MLHSSQVSDLAVASPSNPVDDHLCELLVPVLVREMATRFKDLEFTPLKAAMEAMGGIDKQELIEIAPKDFDGESESASCGSIVRKILLIVPEPFSYRADPPGIRRDIICHLLIAGLVVLT